MDLADLIEPGRVVYAGRASNKEQLLQDLASRAATLLNLDAQTICNALQAREELGSTGLGDGFALPHARIEGLDREPDLQSAADSLTSKISEDSTIAALLGIKATPRESFLAGARLCQGNKRVIKVTFKSPKRTKVWVRGRCILASGGCGMPPGRREASFNREKRALINHRGFFHTAA